MILTLNNEMVMCFDRGSSKYNPHRIVVEEKYIALALSMFDTPNAYDLISLEYGKDFCLECKIFKGTVCKATTIRTNFMITTNNGFILNENYINAMEDLHSSITRCIKDYINNRPNQEGRDIYA